MRGFFMWFLPFADHNKRRQNMKIYGFQNNGYVFLMIKTEPVLLGFPTGTMLALALAYLVNRIINLLSRG